MTTITELQIAREVCHAFMDTIDPAEISVQRIYRALHLLEDEGSEEDQKLIERVFDNAPGLMNYNPDGSWCGPVANENGWTP